MDGDKLKLVGGGCVMGVLLIGLGIAFLRGKVDMPHHRVLGDMSILLGIFFIVIGLILGVGTVLVGLRTT